MDGANNMLLRIANGIPSDRYSKLVVLPDYGELYNELKSKKINTKVFEYDCIVFNKMIYDAHDRHKIDEICQNIENVLKDSELYKFFKEWKPDIVFANTTLGIIPVVLGKMVGAKVILHVHDIPESFLDKQNCINLNKIVDRYSDKIIVIGKAARKALDYVGLKDKCELVYIGVKNHGYSLDEIKEKNLMIREELKLWGHTPLIAYLGRISPEKGIDHFIQAANLLLDDYPHYRFIIIGNAKEKSKHYKELKELIKKLGRKEEIRFVGYYRKIDDILPAIDCLVVPSCYEEPMGAVNVEANLYYKPVVAYDRGGISEVIIHKKNGLLVKKNNITNMAKAIHKIVSNKKEAKRMGRFGHYRALSKFGYSRFMENIIAIIDEVSEGQFYARPYRDGDIVCGSNKTPYLIENGTKRMIQSEGLLELLGIDQSDIKQIGDNILLEIPEGKELIVEDVNS